MPEYRNILKLLFISAKLFACWAVKMALAEDRPVIIMLLVSLDSTFNLHPHTYAHTYWHAHTSCNLWSLPYGLINK